MNLFRLWEYIRPESLDLGGVKLSVDLYAEIVEGCIGNCLREVSANQP